MNYELFNQSTQICRKFSRQTWAKALELARFYGWQAMGTQPPAKYGYYKLCADWHGTYMTNDGQIVRAEDALSLAVALEKSLDDIPNTHIPIDWNPKFWIQEEYPEWLSPDEIDMMEEELQDGLLDIMGTHPFEFFAGDMKAELATLIKFCRSGSFEIL